ncbi:MAG: hypothetical protein NTU98_02045 [Bacteroidetes bacterium]|nr:hypothetical protein [Bacteroidota bacterium]
MKKIPFLLLIFLLMGKSMVASSIKIISGNLGTLKNEKNINIEFRFDGMSIGKFATEQDYINYYVDDRNKKEPGSGEKWKQEWMSNSREKFPLSFTQELNGITNKIAMQFDKDKSEAKYTMIVKTLKFSKCYGLGGKVQIFLEISIVETKNPGNLIAKISVTKIEGVGFGYYLAMVDAYLDAGKEIGTYIRKQLNKTKN